MGLQGRAEDPKLDLVPVLVVGADTPVGQAVVAHLLDREGEVRAFVSDPVAGERFKARGIKVAVGDPSDDSHIEGAGTNAFSAVLITSCLRDGRDLAFADTPESILERWAAALRNARIRRAIWVVDPETRLDPAWMTATPEHAVLKEADHTSDEIGKRAARLDEALTL